MSDSKLIFIFVLFGLVSTIQSSPSGCYRAAVLDHVLQTKGNDPAENLELNLQVYEDAVKLAKENGADIIVFPEEGLIYGIGTDWNRTVADHFAIDIPVIGKSLCTGEPKNVLERLGCLAVKHKIFLAVNLLDRKTCHEMKVDDNDEKCPKDKKFIFNTVVLLDRSGKLMATYHKMHLFGEMSLNVPPRTELVVANTELGRLGLQICFDIIFDTPGHRMAEEHKFDTMLFPTWWFDEAPLLSASQVQMAWAFGNNVTLLASDIHYIEVGARGSGIYNGIERKFVNAMYDDHVARLVIADVPIKADGKVRCPLNPETVVVPQKIPVKNSSDYKAIYFLSMKDIELVPLEKSTDTITACHKGVCCILDYQMESLNPKEQYYLLATNRTRPGSFQWAEEFCALAQCSEKPCQHFVANLDLKTKFQHVKLTGNFSPEATVYPSAIGTKDRVLQPSIDHWNFKQIDHMHYEIWYKGNGPLSALSLHGRVYGRDPPFPHFF